MTYDKLQARRAEIAKEASNFLLTTGGRALTASEQRRMTQLSEEGQIIDGQIAQLDREMREQRAVRATEDQSRRMAAAGAVERLGVKYDEHGQARSGGLGRGADGVYSRGNGLSFFADLAFSAIGGHPQQLEAMQRLGQHAQIVERAAADLPPEFRAGPERRAAGTLEQRVNPNRTDGQGGNFVPPLWIVDEYVDLLRNGRASADRCNVRPLPPGTDSINLPKVATGTATAVQTADAGGVQSTDLTDTSVNGPVRTIAGQQDIALQLLEQSPVNFDEVVFQDLTADYNQQLCMQVISGSGAAGQMKGILTVAGTNGVTYTDATPTLPEMIIPIGQGLSLCAKNGKRIADSIMMTPSLWYWFTTQLDTTGRPLVDLGNGMNSIAVYNENAVAGVAGAIGTTPIVVDLNIPSNLGAGTNETRIIEAAMKEIYLYEGAVRTRVLMEVLSGTLQVRIQLYNYVALIADRRPAAISVLSGTGLIPAAGF